MFDPDAKRQRWQSRLPSFFEHVAWRKIFAGDLILFKINYPAAAKKRLLPIFDELNAAHVWCIPTKLHLPCNSWRKSTIRIKGGTYVPRRRRRITSKKCYEICFRAGEGLPLVAYSYVRLLLGSAVARTQRDDKVILCHDIWNGSHCHMIIVAMDSEMCTNFYGEIQKRITDGIERLLGLKYLDLWEGNAMVAEIADLDAAVDRISYLYANPAQDNLVEQISDFPGFSSWQEFKGNTERLRARVSEKFPWIRLPSIPRLNSRVLSPRQDAQLTEQLRADNKVTHALVRHPNAWMRSFGIDTDTDVADVNSRILQSVTQREGEASRKRKSEKKSVMGVERLRSQPIMKTHTPKKKERKIFLLCSIRELRIKLIEDFNYFCDACRECYRNWKARAIFSEWPSGAFRPPLPPIVNLLPAY